MVATSPTIPPEILTDDNRRRWHHSAIIVVREAQDIYNVSAQELRKAAITHLIKKHFFEELPQFFDNMSTNIQAEMQKNEAFSAESYGESRILYDMMKPFFDKIEYIKIPATISDEKEQYLYKSLVHFLNILKEYMGYLEIKFLELDTPQFKSTSLSPVLESEIWAIRNKNRPYLVGENKSASEADAKNIAGFLAAYRMVLDLGMFILKSKPPQYFQLKNQNRKDESL